MDRISELCSQHAESVTHNNLVIKNVSSNFSKNLNLIPNERGFKMAFLNIVSLPKKLEEIWHPMYHKNIDLLALNETQLDLSFTDNQVGLNGYDMIRKDRSRNGGSVCIILRSSINY